MATTLMDSYLKPKNVSRVSTASSPVVSTTTFLLVEQPGRDGASAAAKPSADAAKKPRRVRARDAKGTRTHAPSETRASSCMRCPSSKTPSFVQEPPPPQALPSAAAPASSAGRQADGTP